MNEQSVEYARKMGEEHARCGQGFTNPYPLGTPERAAWKEAYEKTPKGVPQMTGKRGRSEDEMARDLLSQLEQASGTTITEPMNAAAEQLMRRAGRPVGVVPEQDPSGEQQTMFLEPSNRELNLGGLLREELAKAALAPMLQRFLAATSSLDEASVTREIDRAVRYAVVAADKLLEALHPPREVKQ